jgi:hypothetical protein
LSGPDCESRRKGNSEKGVIRGMLGGKLTLGAMQIRGLEKYLFTCKTKEVVVSTLGSLTP